MAPTYGGAALAIVRIAPSLHLRCPDQAIGASSFVPPAAVCVSSGSRRALAHAGGTTPHRAHTDRRMGFPILLLVLLLVILAAILAILLGPGRQ
jgi:hypothetical protein